MGCLSGVVQIHQLGAGAGRHRIGVLNELRGCQEGVVRRGDHIVLVAREDRSDEAVGTGQLVFYRPQQVRAEPRAGAAAERMDHREALQRVAASCGEHKVLCRK